MSTLRNNKKAYLFNILPALLSFVFMRCGLQLGTNGSISSNEPRPTGTPVSQGQFTGLNAKAVTGFALIFTPNGTTYTLRLEGLDAPSETGLQVQVFSAHSSSPVFSTVLKSSLGNQNYSFTAITGSTFTNVYIYSANSRTNYGAAILQSPI
jgi:hypothetical protein